MTPRSILSKIDSILHDNHSAVLSAVGSDGYPELRWMTPAVIKDRPGAIYAVSSQDYEWVFRLADKPQVTWMIQSRDFSEIVRLKGRMNAINNPSMQNEINDAIGKRLTMFWKNIPDIDDLIVLETIVDEAVYFLPNEGKKAQTVDFRKA